jgi:hypothetical protein
MKTTIKITLLTLLVAFINTTNGISQIRFGIVGGINVVKVKADDFLASGSDYKIKFSNSSRMGYHAGVISQIKIWHLFVQPQLVYTNIRNDIYVENINTQAEDLREHVINRIDLPVLLGYRWSIFKLETGPVASVVISDKSELKDITDYDITLSKATIGFQAGLGLDVSKLSLDFKYEGNLSKLGNGITVNGENYNFDSRARQFIFSIALFF